MRRAWACVDALRPENGALGDSRMMLEQRQLARTGDTPAPRLPPLRPRSPTVSPEAVQGRPKRPLCREQRAGRSLRHVARASHSTNSPSGSSPLAEMCHSHSPPFN